MRAFRRARGKVRRRATALVRPCQAPRLLLDHPDQALRLGVLGSVAEKFMGKHPKGRGAVRGRETTDVRGELLGREVHARGYAEASRRRQLSD